ncbi:hypothetical protein OG887_09535 [Streptomyces sp. NBC_00053]|uniref:hypothetical protein n=1 Tax=unclassified Streptomyces TaxID=2593676 RepID=UPI0022543ECA|nr:MULTISPECIES: hypothetical protein [unclassified Streptomyces]WSX06839.1 hypothetical protein OG355_09515 [Streptomyces sp. NBC_00987]MCX5159303.1 hypothetical protein [Streptomyces sp. NBC_00305]MCX5217826.1 hypothetical protein [Streptomyces sp. NBC_00264]MCX5499619.1 hypothetical protein [Streptomyces sp. NBC_00052]MCX5551845.1 hypothetical protein [Streptomyces sp. NBC_00051]
MSLPGADELFRTTGGMGLQASSPADRRRKANGEARVPGPAGESDSGADGSGAEAAQAADGASREEHSAADADAGESRSRDADRGAVAAQAGRRPQQSAPTAAPPAVQEAVPAPAVQQQRRRGGGRGANRRPSGRERHDEKITVYVSAEELMDLEHARLVLRGEHGLAVDRGRIVREAVAVVLADLESRGDASILVRRLRGR